MEIVAKDGESVTIRMLRQGEYGTLLAILTAFGNELDGDNVDLEALLCGPGGLQSKRNAEQFLNAFFDLAEKSTLPQTI